MKFAYRHNIVMFSIMHEEGSLPPIREETRPLNIRFDLQDPNAEGLILSMEGRVEILGNKVLQDGGEAVAKAKFGTAICLRYGSYNSFLKNEQCGGTGKVRLINNEDENMDDTLVVPDYSVWEKKVWCPPEATKHPVLCRTTAPTMVMEMEWYENRNATDKARHKIQYYYLTRRSEGVPITPDGPPTLIKEAWLVIFPKNVAFPAFWTLPKARFHEWFLLGLVFTSVGLTMLSFLDCLIFLFEKNSFASDSFLIYAVWTILCFLRRYCIYIFYPVVHVSRVPPADPDTPYIAIYFRETPLNPTYYEFVPNSYFLAPWNSCFFLAPPLNINELMSTCR